MRRSTFVKATLAAGAGGAAFATPLLGRAATGLKMNLPVGPDDPMSETSRHFADLVAKKSNGALTVQIFYSGALGTQQASVNGVQTGTIDFTLQTTAWFEPIVPQVQALDLPFLFADDAAAQRVLDGDIGRGLTSELANHGIVVVLWGCNGWREFEFVSNRVTKPADMQGLKIRIQAGPLYVSIIKALGAVPVVIDIGETYLALQQKVVTGLDIPAGTVLSLKYDEVVKYLSLTRHLYNPAPTIMSKMKFDSLPHDQQRAIMDAGRETLAFTRDLYRANEKQALTTLQSRNVAIVEVDHEAFKHAMMPVYGELRGKIGAPYVDRVVRAAS
jgi:tripartite ATP-independent transporter DctP family solute receptor